MALKESIGALAAIMLASCNNPPVAASENAASAPKETAVAEPGATPTAHAQPSFDCTRSSSEMEKLICDDGQLAALDREVARLYGLAQAGAQDRPARLTELRAMQRGWIKGRDDCWKNDDKRICVASAYAQRASELREGYGEARDKDEEGVSTGPFAVTCDGIDAVIGATFVRTEPGMVYLKWLDRGVALFQQQNGSGVRYTGTSFDGDYVFSEDGSEALIIRPGAVEARCRIEQIG